MSGLAARADLERFRAAVTRRIGLRFDDAQQKFLGDVLDRRLDKLGRASDAYLRSLEQELGNGEWSALAQELTVGETYFFRNHEQFRALAEVALPARLAAGIPDARGGLRLLSAGCASGEEPYSMAIVVRETLPGPSCAVTIQGVDINPAVLGKAARGRYSAWALRETTPDIQRKWFRAAGPDLILDEGIRGAVTFSAVNIAADDAELWQPAAYDIIFCRNVLMYFSPEQMRATVARMARSLLPGGFLFLGHAETLRGVSDAFHLRHTHDTFYYERREWVATAPPRSGPPAPISIAAAPPSAAPGEAWFDTIRKATERVAMLMPSAVEASSCAPPPQWDCAPAHDLMRRERFAEALDYVRAGPAERDGAALLLEATLLVHDGQLAAAEDACLRLLETDETNSGAHYLLALCREHAGRRESACEHARTAAFLDPGFAMPRLHLGLMARRAGDRDAARRELGHALILLKREDPSRLFLFGGGFKREALAALCEAALNENGGRP
jgi:chemotaxis protein methyltransferase CheR